MPRASATVTKKTDKALNTVQSETRLPRAEIVRIAIEEYLRNKGYDVDERVQWGGKREKQSA